MEVLDNLVMLNEEPLYNVDFICRRPHSKSNTKARFPSSKSILDVCTKLMRL